MAFTKGHEKIGGRRKGSRNKITESIKSVLHSLLPEDKLAAPWKEFLNHKDPHIRYKAFELANHYPFGKPVQIVAGDEALPPVHIDISAIPRIRERV